MINCVIVDDEPLAREGMAGYVRDVDFLQLVASCENPLELMRYLEKQPVDLIFLDIQMPKMNGIDFLKIVSKPPMVILTTAFPSFALEGFQLNVLDYLVKPITFDRFFKAAQKARDYFYLLRSAMTVPAEKSDYFFIKCGNKYEKIHFADVLYVEGMQNYVTIYTVRGKYITLLNLKNLESNLDPQAFIRVHKSFLVSIQKIDGISGNEISIGESRIPISRNYKEEVLERVVASKLWGK
jgi:two-component system, LytTR family, response regulator